MTLLITNSLRSAKQCKKHNPEYSDALFVEYPEQLEGLHCYTTRNPEQCLTFIFFGPYWLHPSWNKIREVISRNI